jgi:hypothetical protein
MGDNVRCEKNWWARQDLNLGPTDYESNQNLAILLVRRALVFS